MFHLHRPNASQKEHNIACFQGIFRLVHQTHTSSTEKLIWIICSVDIEGVRLFAYEIRGVKQRFCEDKCASQQSVARYFTEFVMDLVFVLGLGR